MIQKMYRENAEDAKNSGTGAFDRLCEAIVATLDTLAAGKITAKELPITPDTNTRFIRYAPGFGGSPPAASVPSVPYTVDALAKFLGEVKEDKIRVAPGFDVEKSAASGTLPSGAYTVDALAKFFGEVKEDKIRVAPGFDAGQSAASGTLPREAYTVDSLAKFLGEVDSVAFLSDSLTSPKNLASASTL